MKGYSLKRRPLSKVEYVVYRAGEFDFPTTALGQTQEIATVLRKLNRNRMMRFRQRVDAFTGYYPASMPVAENREPNPPKLGKKYLAVMIATSPVLHAMLREYHRSHKSISTKPERDAESALNQMEQGTPTPVSINSFGMEKP